MVLLNDACRWPAHTGMVLERTNSLHVVFHGVRRPLADCVQQIVDMPQSVRIDPHAAGCALLVFGISDRRRREIQAPAVLVEVLGEPGGTGCQILFQAHSKRFWHLGQPVLQLLGVSDQAQVLVMRGIKCACQNGIMCKCLRTQPQ